MDALWHRFVAELTAAGYTTDDLSICNDDLFISIAEELRVFSQTEVFNLTHEWRRRFGNGAAPAPSQTHAQVQAPAMEASELVEKAAHLLRRAASGSVTVDPARCTLAPPSQVRTPLPSVATQTLWKLCSPRTMEKLSRGAALTAGDDADEVCASGLVFYRDSASQLGMAGAESIRQAAEASWVLAAFAVETGVARSVTRREATNLSQFRTPQCQAMMKDAGYDALRVEDADCFVTFCTTRAAAVQWLGSVGLQVSAAPPPSTVPAAPAATLTPKRREIIKKHSASRLAASPNARAVGEGASASSPSWTAGMRAANTTSAVFDEDDESASALLSTRCSVHPQKEVEFWSTQEKRLLCSHCLYFDGYTRDNCLPIEQATHLEVPPLEKWMQNVATFSKEITAVMDAFENAEADVRRQQERAVSVIQQEFGRLRSKLDAMERELLAQCEASAKDAAQQLTSSSQEVAHTVQQVHRVVRDAAEPLKRFHDGFTEQTVCIRLLRCVQRAFATWPSVPVPPYMVIESVKDGVFLQSVSAAFDVVPPPTLITGQVELPEAVDVNFLKNGCAE